ncbi:MAG: DUF3320 domain-containing protein [Marivita sp.]|uniref:DUF3320 domain-containing protein n=1 Tax=Marivita sp. TaxID=2003365 RepID=UPI001B2006C8|nr:DUF3320 domain-containing protein [Marivita sp.]MBO6884207.1 DUF3320 domain-containing protein [Marivita sp.]
MNSAPRSGKLAALLEDARRRLVETGTRNRLIHVNRSSKRSNALDIDGERTADIFDLLRVQGKRMRFLARDEKEADDEGDSEGLLLSVGDLDDVDRTARYQDQFLETRLGQEALQRRLLRLFTDARTSEEEQGFNILYLAMGFLRWYESESSQTLRESPLILLPVELVRDDRRATFDLRARDTEIVTNLPLQERLRADFGFELPEIAEDDTFSPEAYFDELAERIENRTRWSIDRDGMQLGFFSFSKLLMMRDLEPVQWPEGAFEDHPVLGGLLGGGFERSEPLFGPQEPLDPRLAPSDLLHVVPADASQTRVIEEVRAGRNLVVQGPPGTGKSQTIANIIAGAAHDGKTVLFVAEKMAALSVVHDRLQKVGLGDLCLEIHSRAANKKAFLGELARTLNAGRAAPEMPEPLDALREARDRLNSVSALLHETVPGYAFTPYRAMAEIARFVGKELPPPRLARDGLAVLDEATRRSLADRVKAFADLLETSGPRPSHPFAGVGSTSLQPTDLQRLEPELRQVSEAIKRLQTTASQLAALAQRAEPSSLPDSFRLRDLLRAAAGRPVEAREATAVLLSRASDPRLQEALGAGRAWAEARGAAGSRFAEAAFEISADALRSRLAPGVGSFWARLFGPYRGASKELATVLSGPLPSAPADRLKLVDELVGVQRRRKELADEEGWLKEVLGSAWRGERTPFAALLAQAEWLGRITAIVPSADPESVNQISAASAGEAELTAALDGLAAVLDPLAARLAITWPEADGITLDRLAKRIEAMRAALDRFGEWARLTYLAAELQDNGLGSLITMLDAGELSPSMAVDEFLYATAEARWEAARSALPGLNELAYLDRHALVEAFRELETARLSETRRLVRAKHLAQLPTGAAGQMGFLRGEMAKQRRHRPIRQMMKAAGQMVQRIKPVLLMSPISIAQYLPPGAAEFDLLVIDEASQVRPEEALGAIARCRQIVVVGDQKQLPPTSFFDRIAGSDDVELGEEAEEEVRTATATEMESVLTLCEARGLNPAMLEWHYRSRDPSLIMVNNAEFYDHRLILPPSPVQNDPEYGLAFQRVPGVYTSRSRGTGRPGTNRIEAEAIAKAVAEHARTRPDLSLGVVAFSKAQSDMLTEVLEVARRQDEILNDFLREGRSEDVFVKNIENVQGDERDVILISVGYGPAEPNGRLTSMSFGPVNGEGGERRLNVLFSRARTRCLVFCSFDPNDIDTSRTSRDGPRVLKRFLEFARSGQMAQPQATGELPDSPLESDVADVIKRLGHPCDHQVGAAGFRIDLGVRHPEQPGRYILAVECDGATYHSALWARERDRLRQDVLEGLGWRFHRIWSTDWFHRRAAEIDRLRVALEAAALAEGPTFSGANTGGRRATGAEPVPEALAESVLPPPPRLSAPAYVTSNFTASTSVELHEAPINVLVDLVTKIVTVEGPIHRDLIARRVSTAFGKARTGGRIQIASDQAVDRAAKSGSILIDGDFIMTADQLDKCPVRDRSGESAPTKADQIPPLEIRAAASLVIAESGEMPREDLIVAIARILGFVKTGKDLKEKIDQSLPREFL